MGKTIAKVQSSRKNTIFGGHSNFLVTRRDIAKFLVQLMGFFLGRALIFSLINPLALPFLSNFIFQGKSFYFTALFTFFGFLTAYSSFHSAKYFISLAVLVTLHAALWKKIQRPSPLLQATVTAAVIFVVSMILMLLEGFSVFLTVIAVLETILTFGMSLVIRKGVEVVESPYKKQHLSNEELISVVILLGAIVAGSADIYIGDVSLRFLFTTLIMLTVAFKGGAALSCMTGVLVGVILHIARWHDISIIPILALAGTFAGLLKFSKVGVLSGFLGAGTVAIFYFSPSLLDSKLFFSVLMANIIFIIMPDRFYFNISSTVSNVHDYGEEYIQKIRELTMHRLNSFSTSFDKLSRTFSGLSEKKTSLSQKDITLLIDDVAARMCTECSMKQFCWENNFYNTYQWVFSMLDCCERKGRIDTIPIEFKEACHYANRFADTTNRIFEKYKDDLIWYNRIAESRELVSEQLLGVSKIIKGLSEELDFDINFKQNLEQAILKELSKEKIVVENVIVLEDSFGKYEVTFLKKACEDRRECSKKIIPIVNRVLNKKMKRQSAECIIDKSKNRNLCTIKLMEQQKYRITTGVAKAAKANSHSSGDSHSFIEFKNGHCIMALSDGMGSGVRASEESAAAVELLEDFVESGFEKDLAIKMINSVLVLKSNGDTFSTLDICSIDLYTGLAEFVKIGASSTYIIRDNEISVIRSSSLPVGILKTVDTETTCKKLKDSDIILMVTDGVDDDEMWIQDILQSFKSNNPQDIADYVMSQSKKLCDDILKDDITIFAARVWETI